MHGGDRYSWLGRPSRPLAPALNAALDDAQRAEHLRSSLAEELYWSFYCHGRPVPARWGEPEPVAPDPWLAAELAAADRGRGGASPGWTVRRVAGDEGLVATARLRARVPRADCTAVTGAVVPGAPVSVSHPGRLAAESPGFVTFLGEAGREHTGPHGVVRAYWNITLASAAPLVAALSGRLNAERVPFRLKV